MRLVEAHGERAQDREQRVSVLEPFRYTQLQRTHTDWASQQPPVYGAETT